jgi:hypothetical protein
VNEWGYVAAAYIGSAVLYGTYVTWLLRKERRLERSSGERQPR